MKRHFCIWCNYKLQLFIIKKNYIINKKIISYILVSHLYIALLNIYFNINKLFKVNHVSLAISISKLWEFLFVCIKYISICKWLGGWTFSVFGKYILICQSVCVCFRKSVWDTECMQVCVCTLGSRRLLSLWSECVCAVSLWKRIYLRPKQESSQGVLNGPACAEKAIF